VKWLAALALIALSGCDQFFGLDKTRLLDASPVIPDVPDEDNDGVPDYMDNCPKMANPDQADYDGDGTGDVCDTCPHLVNSQADDADGDLVGDDCDPHPTGSPTADCLLVFDSFSDASTLARWTVISDPADTPDVQVLGPHHLVLTPHSPYAVGLTAPGTENADGVDVVGHANPNSLGAFNGPVAAATLGRANVTGGYDCWLYSSEVVADGGTVTASSPLIGTAVRDRYVIRHLAERAASAFSISCRVDWGLATGGLTMGGVDPGFKGDAGVFTTMKVMDVEAVAIYGFVGDPLCHTITR
jgi:hypothetical protein